MRPCASLPAVSPIPRARTLVRPVFLLSLILPGCREAPTSPAREPVAPDRSADPLIDVAESSGLDFVHFNGATGKRWMAEVMGAGVALFDYDLDGDLDVYLVQGGPLAPGETVEDALTAPQHPVPLSDRLYRNDLEVRADGSRVLVFTDVTEASGLSTLARGYGMGVATGDVDGDGAPDLYVTRLGENLLLHNRGDGAFEDYTEAAGGTAGLGEPRWSVPAVFFDRDGDGDLDLFVGNYVDFPMDRIPDCRDAAGRPDYCGPSLYRPQRDRLFDNLGDGTFRDATDELGPGDPAVEPGRALGVVAEDLDGDGRIDLYVANDGMRNHFWRQQEDGTFRGTFRGSFREGALDAGLAVNGAGQAEGSMGIAVGDPDGDGDPDLLLTHLITETDTFYVNGGGGLFTDASGPSGLGPPSRRFTGFGVGFFDLDGDGRLEVLTVHGAVQNLDALVTAGDPNPLHEPDHLFERAANTAPGELRFEEISQRAGAELRRSEVSRGAAFGDLDDDGDTDVVVTQNGGPVRLLLNRAADGARWLGLRLVTGDPPRDALGARVALLRDGRPIAWRRVATDGSYASAHDPRVLFGLGRPDEPLPEIDALRITWPDGTVEERAVPEMGRYVEVRRR